MKISIIVPARNNLRYAQWSYDSIQKNKGEHEVEYCFADDASTDGTWEWCTEMMKKDSNFKAIRNETGERVGHTILYDRLVNEVATNEMCIIYHCDMYLCPGALDAIEKHMYIQKDVTLIPGEEPTPIYSVNEKSIVSLTRIEPPLHPDGPEKILLDCGVEPEEFDEEGLLEHIKNRQSAILTSEGIFAPWAFWKKDFQEIGGHDPLYKPQSKEDTDIFNRFQLNGCKFVQTWEGYVYHMTCRGSRRNTIDKAKNIYEDSPEWLAQNQRSTRNFIRKWGHFCKHDEFMKPIVPPKYNVGIRVENCNQQLLLALEPWCDHIYADGNIEDYIIFEQPNTSMDLRKRVHSLTDNDRYDYDDVLVELNGKTFNNESFRHIQYLSEILANDTLELGTFGLDNIKITINNIETYTDDLIVLPTKYNEKKPV